jgi:hypothetical protein
MCEWCTGDQQLRQRTLSRELRVSGRHSLLSNGWVFMVMVPTLVTLLARVRYTNAKLAALTFTYRVVNVSVYPLTRCTCLHTNTCPISGVCGNCVHNVVYDGRVHHAVPQLHTLLIQVRQAHARMVDRLSARASTACAARDSRARTTCAARRRARVSFSSAWATLVLICANTLISTPHLTTG